ncbi:MAG TPA: ester cyclase [Chloroflexota bacterium]|nr:ester cyclase [Chloroflexota bacterium]
MTVTGNKKLVRDFTREVLDKGHLDAADHYLAPDFFNHVTGETGIEAFKDVIRFVRTFLNMPSIVDDIIAEGDKVALFLTARGLHSEPIVLQGTCYTPTGKPFASKQVHLFRARDGLLTEHWSVRNDLTMLLPLGIVQYTTPAGAAERETVLQR